MRLHEHRDAVPNGFTSKGPAPGDTVLKLRIALKQTDIAGLQDVLMDVSTPSSANYGQHLSLEEVNKYVSPKPETIAAVDVWLSENGLSAKTLSPGGDWLGFQTTVSHANELFDTQFSTFVHDFSGAEYIRTLAYSIPTSLKGHLQLVHPTTTFSGPQRAVVSTPLKFKPTSRSLTSDAAPDFCNDILDPLCIQELYNIPMTPSSQPSNKLAVSGFNKRYASEDDLQLFLELFRIDLPPNTTFSVQTLDGGSNPQGSGQGAVEANTDVQYTVGVTTMVQTTFISVGDEYQDGDLEGFLDIINFFLAEIAPPKVLTTSYGANEDVISREMANTLCNTYAQLGARGTSILFSSGDGGVAGSRSASCGAFVPTFPSSCPYLTSVGATQNVTSETAAAFSSGGFSNYFVTPPYQSTAKDAYIAKLGTTNAGKFNTSGRGFPDVATIGTNVVIVNNGNPQLVNGTSCSSPIFASVVALLNDRLLAAGKPVLGFLNPFLYTTGASALNPITSGSNPGCNTNGFPAIEGWNPVTGLGTPDFAKLLTAVGL
ncbi:subtilisin-like protein [Auriscalpium vulgare]|uniref:Subtilisin-like protein n=1 Tax=Auriscalpium vulgare TaxID=40419 RepID=A0ACB8RAC2_9AGAM|nr:subtilisin-like protein [Auriscalpium vulgare]